MTVRLMETVPNFSEGRDPEVLEAVVHAMSDAGADVLDWSADYHHHRSVVTAVGAPEVVEEAAVRAASVAAQRIDLRRHAGLHPRVGALDVLPFVPLLGLTLADAVASAHRVGRRLAGEVGLPVYYYGAASRPAGRALAELRRGGFETLMARWPKGREPDELPGDWDHPGAHPTAGAVCVGARRVLLAWNVLLGGITLAAARAIARTVRERGGGFQGVRALALALPDRGVQVSMNLEDPDAVSPLAVFDRIVQLAEEAGGHVLETEVIGLVPDRLVADAAADRLRLRPGTAERLLSARLADHLARTATGTTTRMTWNG